MTDRSELLAAILADPACDVKRLAYADLLDDEGEAERAEYIRKAIANPHADPGCLCKACCDEVLLMMKVHEPLCPWKVEGGEQYRMDRGFIVALCGPLASLLKHGPAICREHPVERVEVTDRHTFKSNGNDTYYTNGYDPLPSRCWDALDRHPSPQAAMAALNAVVLAELKRGAQ